MELGKVIYIDFSHTSLFSRCISFDEDELGFLFVPALFFWVVYSPLVLIVDFGLIEFP